MATCRFYYDDPEGEGPSPETIHPAFAANLQSAFYYDPVNDFAPFGNDDGAELLQNLEDWYREGCGRGNVLRWLFRTIDEAGFSCQSKGSSAILDRAVLKQLDAEDPLFLEYMDNCIAAAAFGQYKITGALDDGLRQTAITSINRRLLLNKGADGEHTEYFKEINEAMLADLSKLALRPI